MRLSSSPSGRDWFGSSCTGGQLALLVLLRRSSRAAPLRYRANTFRFSSGVRGSAAQFNRSVSSMPAHHVR
jgi:hypothetical protein